MSMWGFAQILHCNKHAMQVMAPRYVEAKLRAVLAGVRRQYESLDIFKLA